MLKMRELHEVPALFDLLSHPEVFPYVRQKSKTSDEYYFVTKQTIEAEGHGLMISRTIADEYCHPIGTINLYDIKNQCGFLATWIGQPYFGKGYNNSAKELFFKQLFYEHNIKAIFIKIRRENIRSLKAISKLTYVVSGHAIFPEIYESINSKEDIYDLFVITKEHYEAFQQFTNVITEINVIDDEGVS